mgnify:CR=1 FL=1
MDNLVYVLYCLVGLFVGANIIFMIWALCISASRADKAAYYDE